MNSISQKMFCYLIGDLLREVPDMRGRTDNITFIDIWEGIYCIVNNKFNIMPALPKAKNWGFDGSGVHAYDPGFGSEFAKLLDTNTHWPLNPSNSKEDNEIAAEEFHQFTKMPTKKLIRDHTTLFVYRHFSNRVFDALKRVLTKKANRTHSVYYG